ncbi:RluA family pseudouridine synthase [Alkalihalobacillus sp. CinArs1]|uniref:RluA family pseudouridine synthase n=1 Tax=Alkalihalobacillus sp. CinArs1 TaxID=2995314 RepID=UPI0022DE71BE|nr:RluA family pseudouridine synthase [Alkalihalobacillus sp. CinArs1]
MSGLQFNWKVEERNDGTLVREFLLREKSLSRSMLTDIKFKGGSIRVNGEIRNVRTTLHTGDLVSLTFPEEKVSETMKPIEMNLRITFEDEHFLLINKPSNLPTIPSRHSESSLAQGVLAYYQKHDLNRTVHAVNRLDRDTSGLVLFAKHRYAHDLLSRQQKNKTMKRTYYAIIHGVIEQKDGVIDQPIGRKEGSIIERAVREDGQRAVTHYRTIRASSTKSLLEIKLLTGRTHQIRVHLSSIGHPLLGDDLYGGEKGEINRQALHSKSIAFYHPFLEKTLTFTAELEEDMRNVMEMRGTSL